MANQIVITSGAKVRGLNGVLTGTSGIVSSVPLGAANGVATLDSGGKVPVSQLPSSVVTYLGTWNAATNTPTLTNGTGDAGDMYICNVAGTVNFGAGPVTFAVGDWVLYGSGTWQKSSGQNGTVTSVGITESGDSLNITGSPITTSGTINIGFNGTNLQYVNGAGNLTTFPILTGYVTAVSGTAPVVSSGGTTPAISMAAATGSVDGYLLATDFAIFSAKQSALTFSSPLVNTSGTISIPAATTSVNGYLASADFTTFNNKQNAITLTTTGSSGVSTLVGATLNIPDYGSALTGYVTLATTQTITGAKTFSGYTTFTSTVDITSGLTFSNSGFTLLLQPPTLSVNRTVTLPNATGTLALTSDISYPVSSVFGRTGAVVATNGDYTTAQVTESGNLYFTDSRARLALSGSTGISYNNTTGVITNSAPDQVVALTASTGISVTGTYPNFTITNTSPSSGGTVTSVAALTIGTSGTDLSSSVANSTTTPVITLNVPTASAANRGALSSADWTTFNNKQGAITLTTTGTSGAATFSANTLNIPNYGSALSGYLPLTGGTLTGALSGTSASFSSTLTVSSRLTLNGVGTSEIYTTDASGLYLTAATSGGMYLASESRFIFRKATSPFTEYMRIESTGNVGIGTVSPVYTFHTVSANTTIGAFRNNGAAIGQLLVGNTVGDLTLRILASGDALIFPDTSKYLAFGSNGASERMRIFSDGNIGIATGASNAGYKLDVNGTGRFSGTITSSTGNNTRLFTSIGATTGYQYMDMNNTTGRLVWGINGSTANAIASNSLAYGGVLYASNSLQLGVDGDMKLTIASTGAATFSSGIATLGYTASTSYAALFNGSVGIGTSSPQSKLHIGESGAAAQLWLQRTDGYNPIKLLGGTLADGNGFKITMNTTDAFAITSGGNLLVGTTTDSGYKLDVNGTGRFSGNGSNGYLYVSGNAGSGGSTNPAYLQGMNFSWNKSNGGGESLITYTGAGGGSNIRFGIGYWNNTTYSEQFTIASTGAAIFSSSVTVGSYLNLYSGAYATQTIPSIRASSANNLILNAASTGTLYLNYETGSGGIYFGNGASGQAAVITSAGAATFSSSVTATGVSNSGEYTSTQGNNTRLFYNGSATTGYQYMSFKNTSGQLLIGVEGSAAGSLQTNNSAYSTVITTATATDLSLGTNQVERMRITSGGQVSIGPSGTVYGTNLLNVNGGIYATSSIAAVVAADLDMLVFQNTGATYSKACVVASMTATGGTGSYFFYGQQSTSTAAIKIFSNGNIQNTNNSYGAISDARLKENIKDATPKLDDLMKVKVRNYNLKGESNKQLGVISQELEAIFPNMIEESTNMGENMKIKGVKYSVFVPMLIKAVQELKAEIEILKNK